MGWERYRLPWGAISWIMSWSARKALAQRCRRSQCRWSLGAVCMLPVSICAMQATARVAPVMASSFIGGPSPTASPPSMLSALRK